MESKGRIIKRGAVRSPAPASGGPGTVAAKHAHEPTGPEARCTVELHRDGDLIRAIEVTCPCGHTMILECDYPEESA
ncbi:MAG: hypothetical protein R3F20_11750 [Planctomycetota bacterium]